MFRLWHLAESDLLSTSAMYRLRDTGQGLNRVQHAPKTSREMHAILHRAQRDIGSWVGSRYARPFLRVLLPLIFYMFLLIQRNPYGRPQRSQRPPLYR